MQLPENPIFESDDEEESKQASHRKRCDEDDVDELESGSSVDGENEDDENNLIQ